MHSTGRHGEGSVGVRGVTCVKTHRAGVAPTTALAHTRGAVVEWRAAFFRSTHRRAWRCHRCRADARHASDAGVCCHPLELAVARHSCALSG